MYSNSEAIVNWNSYKQLVARPVKIYSGKFYYFYTVFFFYVQNEMNIKELRECRHIYPVEL